jgi:hypothetical protein
MNAEGTRRISIAGTAIDVWDNPPGEFQLDPHDAGGEGRRE